MRNSTKINSALKFLNKNDPVIARLITKHGKCLLAPHNNYFKSLCSSIISQQLSAKAASTIFNRFSLLLQDQFTPNSVLSHSSDELRSCGISFRKATYLFSLSDLFLSDSDFFENVDSYSNSDIISKLTSVKGIGLWTSQMFLIFNLCRLDVMPYDDVSIKNSVKINYNLSSIPSKSELETISAKWGKYSSVACWYLWRDIDS